jgi:hypothetical protein
MVRVAILFIAALFTGGLTSMQAPDAATVLSGMRQALGGDAIAAVRAFSVETTEERHFLGRSMATRVEWVCVLPDRFIQVRRFGGRSGEVTQTRGFSGDDLIQTLGGNVRLPPIAAHVAAAAAEAQAATRRAFLTAARQHFSRLMIGMLGITSAYPLDAAYVVQETLDGKPVHVLELTAADGYQSRLYVDTATHLPRMISWMGRPDPSPQTRPPVDPSADLPLVERRIFFSDYKISDGLNWPHRLKEVVAKQIATETRLGKFRINPTIDPSRFVVEGVNRD